MEVSWPDSTTAWSCQKFIILLQNVPGFYTLFLSAWRKVCNTSPYLLFLPMMCKARMPPDRGGENLDFEPLSPFQQPVYAVPRLCLCFAFSQKALKVSLSSRLCSQGCTFHRGQGSTAHAGQWTLVVDKAESLHTPSVPKSLVIQFIRSQEVQRKSCVKLDTLSLTFPSHCYSHFFHTEIHILNVSKKIMIPTSQLQEIKMCFASHLLRLFTSLLYFCPSSAVWCYS